MAASGSDIRVGIVAETTYGTTPATPAFAVLRTTNGGLRAQKVVQRSDERQQHHNVIDELQVGLDADGSYEFEMSHASFDTIIEGALGSTWSSNVIRNGVAMPSFTIEETIQLASGSVFRRFPGAMVNTLSLNITAREKITGSVGILAQKEATPATAAIAGATYPVPNSEVIMTGSGSVGTVTIGAVGSVLIRSLQLEINRNLRRLPVVGQQSTPEMNLGQVEVTGTIEAYFTSEALYSAALAHQTAAISATIGHDANKKYTFSIPRARWGNANLTAGGNNDDMIATIPFVGTLVSSPANHAIQITRAVV